MTASLAPVPAFPKTLKLDDEGFREPYEQQLRRLETGWKNAAPGRDLSLAHYRLRELFLFEAELNKVARLGATLSMEPWSKSPDPGSPFRKVQLGQYSSLIRMTREDPMIDLLTFVTALGVFDVLAMDAIERRRL